MMKIKQKFFNNKKEKSLEIYIKKVI